jgi:CRP-like cAMP-binding protein
VTLSLTSEQFRQLLSTSPDLVEELVRMMSQMPAGDQLVVRTQSAAEVSRLSAEGLKPIERVFVLENVFGFAAPTADDMLALAATAREVRLAPGHSVLAEGERPHVLAVLSGRVRVEPAAGGPAVFAGPGEVVGFYETLAGRGLARRAVAEDAVRALRIDREDLFELLAQRSPLLQRLFKGLFRQEQPVGA